MRVLASNQVIPNAIVGGITDKIVTEASPIGPVVYSPGFFRMQLDWGKEIKLKDPNCDAFCRTLVHEFAHYALLLYDEYYS